MMQIDFVRAADRLRHVRRARRGDRVEVMSKVLVTGGSGVFGGVLKRRLLRDGYAVVAAGGHGDGTTPLGDSLIAFAVQ